MALFDWDPRFETGVERFDEEHKKLIRLVRDLQEEFFAGKGGEVLGEVLNELVDYARTHFVAEEGEMEACRYPDLIAHRAEHEKFMKKVDEFKKGYVAGTETITMEVLNFLQEWVAAHIMEVDKRYGPYLKAGPGVSA